MTRQLFPSPSQGALICAGGGKEGRLAAAQRAGEPGGRTQLCTPGLGLAAARFPPRLPDPRGIQFLEAEGSQRRPARERALLHPHNVPWAELLVLAAGSGS